MKVVRLDHVQLAMPAGAEPKARAFYGGLLELQEIPKPSEIASRGGVWFQCGSLQLHLGIESDFRPARKAHPALVIEGYAELLAALVATGYDVIEDTSIPAVIRCFTFDPFGNRIELISTDAAKLRE
ncbi:MAG: VOC family protein [Burkholderiales bacterium]